MASVMILVANHHAFCLRCSVLTQWIEEYPTSSCLYLPSVKRGHGLLALASWFVGSFLESLGIMFAISVCGMCAVCRALGSSQSRLWIEPPQAAPGMHPGVRFPSCREAVEWKCHKVLQRRTVCWQQEPPLNQWRVDAAYFLLALLCLLVTEYLIINWIVCLWSWYHRPKYTRQPKL